MKILTKRMILYISNVSRPIARFLTATLMVILLPGCSSESPMQETSKETAEAMEVTFKVIVPTVGQNASEKDGRASSDFENLILENGIDVTLYDNVTGQFLGQVEFLSHGMTTLPGQYIYDYHGHIFFDNVNIDGKPITEEELTSKTAKIVVTANADWNSNNIYKMESFEFNSGLSALTFEKSGKEGEFDAIPMWGVTTKSLADRKRGELFDLGTVPLIRAMAKVEVDFDRTNSEFSNLEISEINVSNMNPTGYVLPAKWKDMDFKDTDDWDNLNNADLHRPFTTSMITDSQNAVDSQILGTLTISHGGNTSVVFYIPEIKNSTDNEAVMTVKYNMRGQNYSNEGKIHFRAYDEGSTIGNPWDIVRNNHYQFLISGIDDALLQFNVSVDQFNTVDDILIDMNSTGGQTHNKPAE